MEKKVKYSQNGERSGKKIKGTFNILSDNMSTLEISNESDIVVLKEENLNDKDIYIEREFKKNC